MTPDDLLPRLHISSEQMQKYIDEILNSPPRIILSTGSAIGANQQELFKDAVCQALKPPSNGERMDVWMRDRVEELERMLKDRLEDDWRDMRQYNDAMMTGLFKDMRLEMAVLQDQIAELFELLSDE